jgi:4-hydroxybenzoyl-CoA reductase beta subunit
MHLPKFEYFQPSTVEDAIHLLEIQKSGARLAAGGTDLYPRMKYGLTRPEAIISLRDIPVTPPTLSQDGILNLDAFMPIKDVVSSRVILDNAPLLSEAAGRVASEEIRVMATLGGNLCQESRCLYYNQGHSFQFIEPCFKRGGDLCYFVPKGKKCLAVYMSDTAPALMCLNAKVNILGSGGERQIPIEDIYSGDAKRPLEIGPTEILSQINIAKLTGSAGWAYKKFSLRGGVEFAGVGVATVLQMGDGKKVCEQAGITVGAIAASPLRASNAESLLTGKEITDSLLKEAAKVAAEEIKVVPHHGYSRPYLQEILRVQTGRALGTAYERACHEI